MHTRLSTRSIIHSNLSGLLSGVFFSRLHCRQACLWLSSLCYSSLERTCSATEHGRTQRNSVQVTWSSKYDYILLLSSPRYPFGHNEPLRTTIWGGTSGEIIDGNHLDFSFLMSDPFRDGGEEQMTMLIPTTTGSQRNFRLVVIKPTLKHARTYLRTQHSSTLNSPTTPISKRLWLTSSMRTQLWDKALWENTVWIHLSSGMSPIWDVTIHISW